MKCCGLEADGGKLHEAKNYSQGLSDILLNLWDLDL